LIVAIVVIAGATSAHAAEMSASLTAPTIDGADIANYGTVIGTDKWWCDTEGSGRTKGQTFTTGSEDVLLNALTYQVGTDHIQPTKTYVIRVGTVSGSTFTEIYRETATQTFIWNVNEYMTWTLDSPVFLSANAVYAIDVGMTSSTTHWSTGIPYINLTNNDYPDGARFWSGTLGVGTDTIAVDGSSRDRAFHLDLPTGPPSAYWDLNGTAAGAGGGTPAGSWAGANWNAVAGGTGSTAAWTAGNTAVFAAGGDATGAYSVTVDGTQDIGGLVFEEGTVTLTGGTALRMTGTTMINVAPGRTATIATAISEDAPSRPLIKKGDGTLILSGAGSYTGETWVVDGTLRLGAVDALPGASAVTVGDYGGGGAAATLDLNGNSVTLGHLTLVDNATVTTSGAATLTTAALTYNAGALTLGSTAVSAGALTVNADLDISGSTVTADTAVTVNNASLTVGGPVATQTLTLNGGSIVGGSATASVKYSLANIPVYSADITGAAADLVIGEGQTNDATVKLTGTNNTYGGITRIDDGFLEVSADAGNLGSGRLTFNGGILQTSGTFERQLGAANDVYFQGGGGFAARGGDLTVTLIRADGVDGPLFVSYPTNRENGISGGQWGSPTADSMVELTNDLTADHGPGGGNQSYHLNVRTSDNPNSSTDITLFSGDITNPGTANQVLINKSGAGTLWLTGTNSGFSAVYIGGGNQSVLRAVDGVGLPSTPRLQFNQGVLESHGTFQRQLGNGPGLLYFNNEGGFSAYGGPLEVGLVPAAGGSPGDLLTWNGDLRGKNLYMGSPTADNVVTFMNGITGPGGNYNKTIYVSGNPDVDTDYVVFAGPIGDAANGIRELSVIGTVNPGEVRFTGDVMLPYYLYVRDRATVRINGTFTSTNGDLRARTGGRIGGTGTVSKLRAESTGILAPGNSVGTLTATGNTTLDTGSIYEWEVGQLGETDVLNITGGTLNLNDFVLKILDADGYVANATDQLPVFTYDADLVTVNNGFADDFDVSALDGTWTVGAFALTDDTAGLIYLTGLSGGALDVPELPGDANSNGFVDDDDLAVLLSNWEADPGTITTWQLGDFTGDTDVDDDDLAVLLGNWTGPPPGGAAVPEPATLALLGLGGLSVLRRRRK